MSTKTTSRVQVEFPPAALERLQRLRDKTEAVSYAEVLKRALQIYEALVEEDATSEVILRRRKDGHETECKILF